MARLDAHGSIVQARGPIARGGRRWGRRPPPNPFAESNPSDLQNRQAHVAHALVGSTPAPLRSRKSCKSLTFGGTGRPPYGRWPDRFGKPARARPRALVVPASVVAVAHGRAVRGVYGHRWRRRTRRQGHRNSPIEVMGRNDGARIRAGTDRAVRVPRQAEELERDVALDLDHAQSGNGLWSRGALHSAVVP